MLVTELMSSPPITIGPEATVKDAARLMLRHNVSCLPVVDAAGKLVGIITHTDFGLHPKYQPVSGNLYQLFGSGLTPRSVVEVSRQVGQKLVGDVMRHQVFTINADKTVAEAAEIMLSKEIHRLPVLRDGRLVGIITRHDFMKLIAQD